MIDILSAIRKELGILDGHLSVPARLGPSWAEFLQGHRHSPKGARRGKRRPRGVEGTGSGERMPRWWFFEKNGPQLGQISTLG